jgi:dCMP deaminase
MCSYCDQITNKFAKEEIVPAPPDPRPKPLTRPKYNKWDLRYLALSGFIASFSKDPSTKTGAVITRPDRSPVSVGFNGFPACMPDAPERYDNRESKYSRIVHCEVNAQLFAREPLHGYTLFTWPFASCDRCCVQMLQAGIRRFVSLVPTQDGLSRWGDAFERTKGYILESGAEYIEVPRNEVKLAVKDSMDFIMAEFQKL